jgi:hypothetical protein
MLTNAAREDSTPCAPRSHSGRAWLSMSPRIVRGACWLVIVAACGADAGIAPGSSTYVAELNGANERPPRPTSGTGRATFTVDGGLATYEVTVSGLSGAATVAHVIIGGEQTPAGQIVVALDVRAQSGTIATGTIDLGRPVTYNNSTISGDSLRSLFERGTAYVNVYSTTYPSGEVRGQITRRSP